MSSENLEPWIAELVGWATIGLELAALVAIAAGFVWHAGVSVIGGMRKGAKDSHAQFRRGLGRSTLTALELLVAADILRSVVLEPSLANLAVLAALVGIRTFLSFSIDVELDGCWPWERAKTVARKSPANAALPDE